MSKPRQLASERVIINSAMSFSGSAQRSWRMRETARAGLARRLITVLILLLVIIWWVAVVFWYLVAVLVLGGLTIPYRLLRRGVRKRKAEALRHREMLSAVEKTKD